MRIITVSREYGSGGRELGRMLSEILSCDYYDREIISAVARRTGMDEEYIEVSSDNSILRGLPVSRGRTLSGVSFNGNTAKILAEQHKIIREIGGRGRDCVIVGRCADVILGDYDPFNLFVYADMKAKIARCRGRADILGLSDKEVERHIRRIDQSRFRTRELIAGGKWGRKESYHLLVNTSGCSIQNIAPAVAVYIRAARKEGN